MKNIGFFCLAILLAVTSCRDPKQNTTGVEGQKWKFDKLSTENIIHIDNDSTKPGMKLHLEFNYPSVYDNDTILGYVQRTFVNAFAGKEYIDLKPKDAFEKVEKESIKEAEEYGKDAADDGPDFSEYYQNIVTTIADTSNINYITAKTVIEQYTGGAHGMHNTLYYNADTRTGDAITEENLFKHEGKAALTQLIKELLNERANSKNDDAITLLDPESIAPNGNFYFNKAGIVYVFNTYEVAPYSDGVIEIELPFEKVKDIIATNYNFLITPTK